MAKQDARKLDHATLEAIRIRAVQRVQAGESPEVVIRALGFTRRCIYSWLAWISTAPDFPKRRVVFAGHAVRTSGILFHQGTVTGVLSNPEASTIGK